MSQRLASASFLAFCSACGQADLQASADVQSVDDIRAVAFRDDCADSLSDMGETFRRIDAAGWTKIDPGSQVELKSIYDTAAASIVDFPGASVSAFSRNVGDYHLYMLISSEVPTELGKANGCYVYDFDADSFAADPDIGAVVESWLGEPPSEATNQAGVISQKKWVSPAKHPQFASIRVASVPAGSPVEAAGLFSGAAWAATALAD
jgi:hypothetical protein